MQNGNNMENKKANAVFCIPICMTTVYSSQRLCRGVVLVSLGVVLALSARLILGAATQEEQMMLLPQALIAVCILLSMWKVAQTAIKMTDGQKQKLIRFVSDIRHEQRMSNPLRRFMYSRFLSSPSCCTPYPRRSLTA